MNQKFQLLRVDPAGIRRQNNDVLTSMRRDEIISTPGRRHFNVCWGDTLTADITEQVTLHVLQGALWYKDLVGVHYDDGK